MNELRHWSTETLAVLACCIALSVFEAGAAPVDPKSRVMVCLSKCVYLPPVDSGSEGHLSTEDLSEALKKFQSRMGIDPTGILDGETARRLTEMPGYGDPNIVGSNPRSRSKRNPLPNPCVYIPNGPIICW